MAKTRIFDNAAGAATSSTITLEPNSKGAYCTDISVVFTGAPAGVVSVLVKDSAGVFQTYANLQFTENSYETLEIYGTNQIQINLDGSVTGVTVEV